MRRWDCAVCGHIHSGETPPSSCPVCGASAEQFVLFSEERYAPVRTEGKKVVIVGAGIAGFSAAQELRTQLPDSDIHLFNASQFAGVINRAIVLGWDLSSLRRRRMTVCTFLEALSERTPTE